MYTGDYWTDILVKLKNDKEMLSVIGKNDFLQTWPVPEKYHHFGQIFLHLRGWFFGTSLHIVPNLLNERERHTDNVTNAFFYKRETKQMWLLNGE